MNRSDIVKGTLYTSYFAKIKEGKGLKISVSRYNPKWLTDSDYDIWLQELAPPKELLDKYNLVFISWEDFKVQYCDWLTQAYFTNKDVNRAITTIEKLLNDGQDITIYCYEKPTDNCHRHLLGNAFNKMGFEVKEIEYS